MNAPDPASTAPIPFRRLLLMPWRWSRWTLGLALAVNFLVVYGVTYAVLAEKALYTVDLNSPPGYVRSQVMSYVCYPRMDVLPPDLQQTIGLLFAPAHWLDRLMRPTYWEIEPMPDNVYYD